LIYKGFCGFSKAKKEEAANSFPSGVVLDVGMGGNGLPLFALTLALSQRERELNLLCRLIGVIPSPLGEG
jgi:hypothetical protein